MGFTSIIGMVICFGAIIFGVFSVGGNMMDFVDLASFLLVVVPTIGAIITAFPISILSKVPGHFKTLISKGFAPEDYINQIVGIAKKARTEGILSLENEPVTEPFMKYALTMIIDGVEESRIRDSLADALDGMKSRHTEAISIYEKAASFAPAFGMCATVIGLVNMLKGLDFTNPDAINSLGENMAMALITTLYGSMVANIFFIPIATRLKTLHKREVLCKLMIANGMLAIQSGENPSMINDMLIEQLSQKSKKAFEGGGATGGKQT